MTKKETTRVSSEEKENERVHQRTKEYWRMRKRTWKSENSWVTEAQIWLKERKSNSNVY